VPPIFVFSGGMPRTTLTAQGLRTLSALDGRRTEYFDRELAGFSIRVTPSGGKSFSVLYRRGRRLRRYTLGRYPVLSLAEARTLARRSPWVFRNASGFGPLSGLQKAIQRVRRRAGIELRGHDLRRTAASNMASMGTPRIVIARILNHVETGVTAVYDRHSYDREKREALDAWGRWLEGLLNDRSVAGIPPASEVPAFDSEGGDERAVKLPLLEGREGSDEIR